MSTDEEATLADRDEPELIEMILKGEGEEAAALADKLSREADEANDLLDAIAEAMNIATDLHEVEKYTAEQVEMSERAAERALETVAPRIKVEQSRIHGRVMVASLKGDPHSFEKTLLLTMLKACGFTPVDGGTDLSATQLTRAVSSEKPDVVAVPIVTSEAAELLKGTVQSLKSAGGKPGIVAYGRGSSMLSGDEQVGFVEHDSLGAIGRIVELLISRANR